MGDFLQFLVDVFFHHEYSKYYRKERMQGNPRISFTFPYRWLKEDRKFLKKNIEAAVVKGSNFNPMHARLTLGMPNAYIARLKQHAYQPKTYRMTKEEMQELLEKSMMNAKCIELEKLFVQTDSRTSLPVMELEIFY